MVRQIVRLALGPVLLWQGARVRRDVLRLPEPEGPREGLTGAGPRLSLLILGDSAAAGVGVATQDDALSGRLVRKLTPQTGLHWRLFAKTGWTTGEALAALDDLTGNFDVAVISLGVNDVTTETPRHRYIATYARVVSRLRQNHGVRAVIASALPPMGAFPALPQPLRWYMGQQARAYGRALAEWAASEPIAQYLPFEVTIGPEDMAADGFHPGPRIYQAWADSAAAAIARSAPRLTTS
ncbi:MAG: SGNH/GDSL hydrolase family protein [Pseudomonadota bacterium]